MGTKIKIFAPADLTTEIHGISPEHLFLYSYGAYESALVTQVSAPDLSWVFIKMLESTKNNENSSFLTKIFKHPRRNLKKEGQYAFTQGL